MIHPLRTFREKRDPPLSQEQLADMLGVSRVTITRWEAGSRRIDQDKLPLVAALTGIPRRFLRPDLASLLEDKAAASEPERAVP